MNLQIFGTKKCFETKKAQRYFKERNLKFQGIDLSKFGMSLGELKSVVQKVGIDSVINQNHPDAPLLAHLAYDDAKIDKIFEDPTLLRTPIVRNGKLATVGYCPEIWASWS